MNKKRIIFWGVFSFILTVLTIVGLVSYNLGYGERGKIKKELKPIVNTFNNLNDIKNLNKHNIKVHSSIKGSSIVVIYKTNTSNSYFTFEYSIKDNIKLLTIDYNVVDEAIAEKIIAYMIDTVSVLKGHNQGDVLSKYTLTDFINKPINYGINYFIAADFKKIMINIDTSPLDNEDIPDAPKNNDFMSFTIPDEIKGAIQENNYPITYENEEKTLLIYITNEEDLTILFKDNDFDEEKDNSKTYNLISNIIGSILGKKAYEDFIMNYPILTTTKTIKEKLTVEVIETSELEIFNNITKIFKINIKK